MILDLRLLSVRATKRYLSSLTTAGISEEAVQALNLLISELMQRITMNNERQTSGYALFENFFFNEAYQYSDKTVRNVLPDTAWALPISTILNLSEDPLETDEGRPWPILSYSRTLELSRQVESLKNIRTYEHHVRSSMILELFILRCLKSIASQIPNDVKMIRLEELFTGISGERILNHTFLQTAVRNKIKTKLSKRANTSGNSSTEPLASNAQLLNQSIIHVLSKTPSENARNLNELLIQLEAPLPPSKSGTRLSSRFTPAVHEAESTIPRPMNQPGTRPSQPMASDMPHKTLSPKPNYNHRFATINPKLPNGSDNSLVDMIKSETPAMSSNTELQKPAEQAAPKKPLVKKLSRLAARDPVPKKKREEEEEEHDDDLLVPGQKAPKKKESLLEFLQSDPKNPPVPIQKTAKTTAEKAAVAADAPKIQLPPPPQHSPSLSIKAKKLTGKLESSPLRQSNPNVDEEAKLPVIAVTPTSLSRTGTKLVPKSEMSPMKKAASQAATANDSNNQSNDEKEENFNDIIGVAGQQKGTKGDESLLDFLRSDPPNKPGIKKQPNLNAPKTTPATAIKNDILNLPEVANHRNSFALSFIDGRSDQEQSDILTQEVFDEIMTNQKNNRYSYYEPSAAPAFSYQERLKRLFEENSESPNSALKNISTQDTLRDSQEDLDDDENEQRHETNAEMSFEMNPDDRKWMAEHFLQQQELIRQEQERLRQSHNTFTGMRHSSSDENGHPNNRDDRVRHSKSNHSVQSQYHSEISTEDKFEAEQEEKHGALIPIQESPESSLGKPGGILTDSRQISSEMTTERKSSEPISYQAAKISFGAESPFPTTSESSPDGTINLKNIPAAMNNFPVPPADAPASVFHDLLAKDRKIINSLLKEIDKRNDQIDEISKRAFTQLSGAVREKEQLQRKLERMQESLDKMRCRNFLEDQDFGLNRMFGN